jgi:hypothetical protein
MHQQGGGEYKSAARGLSMASAPQCCQETHWVDKSAKMCRIVGAPVCESLIMTCLCFLLQEGKTRWYIYE